MAYAQSDAMPGSTLLALATAYCDREGIAEAAFGRHAVGDPQLIEHLRRGRQPTRRVCNRTLAFIDGKPACDETYLLRTDDPHPILADIARFLLATGLSDAMFGRMALGDPNFVEDVRCGRDVRRLTERKVRAYMEQART
jgi:tRNA-dihydrouridine synthase